MADIIVGIIGLGYVGLPLVVAFGPKYQTIGFDIKKEAIENCRNKIDLNNEVDEPGFAAAKHLRFTTEAKDLHLANFIIVAVPTPIDAANQPDSCDLLILESTYGDRFHPSRKGRVEALQKLLEKAFADKGIVYIPAFALGRTQELLYELDRIGTKIPVFVDSPLGLEITRIYSTLEEYWDKEANDLKAKGNLPFGFKGLYAVNRYHRTIKSC